MERDGDDDRFFRTSTFAVHMKAYGERRPDLNSDFEDEISSDDDTANENVTDLE